MLEFLSLQKTMERGSNPSHAGTELYAKAEPYARPSDISGGDLS